MSTLKYAFSLVACVSLTLGTPAWSDEDIPGVVVVQDEDAFGNDIAFSAMISLTN